MRSILSLVRIIATYSHYILVTRCRDTSRRFFPELFLADSAFYVEVIALLYVSILVYTIMPFWQVHNCLAKSNVWFNFTISAQVCTYVAVANDLPVLGNNFESQLQILK